MATCKDCLHFEVCDALELNGIPKISPSQCGCYKSTTDVVEVVRCKDCKFNKILDDRETCVCIRQTAYRKPTDFCSYGERRISDAKIY